MKDINSATKVTAIDASDQLFVSDGGTALAKIDYNVLAKAIIEQYTGSSVAGKAQSLKAALDTLNSKTAVNVTAAENVTIDVNKSYKIGKMLFLSVKGHVSANIDNGNIFTVDSSATLDPVGYTLFCGIGSAWNVTSVGYLYINLQTFSARVQNGQYFHICQMLPIS